MFAEFTSWFDWLSFDLFNTLAVDCIVQPSLYEKFVFTQTLPLVLVGVIKAIERANLGKARESSPEEVQAVKAATLGRVFLLLFLLCV